MTLPESRWADLGGQVHWVDLGGPDDGPLLVLVHGLGGSHANWLALAPLLAPTCRMVALDLPGFGRTRGYGRSTSVRANRDLLHLFIREVSGGPAIVVGNSMGGLITAFEAATHPRDVAGAVLVDPALPPPKGVRLDPLVAAVFAAYATPGVGSRLISHRRRRLTPEQLAVDTLRLCCVDPGRIPPDVLEAHLELARSREYYTDMEAEFVAATRSLLAMVARRRQYAAMLRRIVVPVLLLHGEKDRLVSVASARVMATANPSWRYEEFPDVGHVPQLEAPERTASIVLDWLAHDGARAAEDARGVAKIPSAPVAAS